MYKELVERLRKMYTLCAWDELKDTSDAIEKLLSENIQLKRRIVFWDKNTFGKLRAELDHLRHERDQAVEELHRNTDAVPVVRCKDCKASCFVPFWWQAKTRPNRTPLARTAYIGTSRSVPFTIWKEAII